MLKVDVLVDDAKRCQKMLGMMLVPVWFARFHIAKLIEPRESF